MYSKGAYVLAIGKYDVDDNHIGTVYKYIWIKEGSSGSSSTTDTSGKACYCRYDSNDGEYYCTWATSGNASFPNKNTTYNTEAKCNAHIQTTCCHYNILTGKYVNSTTIKGNCVGSSKCGGMQVVKKTCTPPTNLQISSKGIVSWTNSSTATGYVISFDGSTWNTPATNNGNYLSNITKTTGTRTVYVKSICDDTVYNGQSTPATKSVRVYKVSLTASEGISNVYGWGNYIEGYVVTIHADVKQGYEWRWWKSNLSGKSYFDNRMTLTVNADANLTAHAAKK